LIEAGPTIDAPAGYGSVTRLARRLSLRLGRHTQLHQRDVDRELLGAIAALDQAGEATSRSVTQLDRRIDELQAAEQANREHLIELEVRSASQAHGTARCPSCGLEPPADPHAAAAAWQARLTGDWATERSGVTHPRHPAVRVETDVGPLLVHAHDRVIHAVLAETGVWEKEEADQLRALLAPGMAFVDIGAHVGYMTLVAAEAVGPSGWGVAVEPAPGNFELLRANLASAGVSGVCALPVAAWSETGRVPFSLSDVNTGDHRAYARPDSEMLDVLAFALDDVLPPDVNIDVVKVDAQGTDHRAIRGMARMLARCRPVLVVEYWPPGIEELGDDPREVLQYYRDLGYEITVLGNEAVGGCRPSNRCSRPTRTVRSRSAPWSYGRSLRAYDLSGYDDDVRTTCRRRRPSLWAGLSIATQLKVATRLVPRTQTASTPGRPPVSGGMPVTLNQVSKTVICHKYTP